MDLATETRWREGLEEAGREAVQRYLIARPGAAEDLIDEFVFEAPYPTRAFCRDWCAEKDSIIYEFSGRSAFIGVLVALIAIAGGFASSDLWLSVNHPVPTQTAKTNGYGPTNSTTASSGGGGRGGGAPGSSSAASGGSSDPSTTLDTATNLDTPIGGPTINTSAAASPVGGPTVVTPRVDQTVLGSTAATSPTPAPPIAVPFPGTAPGGAGSLTVWTPNATSPLATPSPGLVSSSGSRGGVSFSAPVVTPTQATSPSSGPSGGGRVMQSKPQTSR